MLKIYIPAYRDFVCSAGSCSENCCGVFRVLFFNWEKKLFEAKPEWQDADGNGRPLTAFLKNDREECCLSKKEDGFCQFLTKDNLCGLQLKYGPGALPSVCRTYPRLITRFPDRTEYALDTCCVQVLRMLENWTPGDFDFVGDEIPSDEAFLVRKRALEILADPSMDLDSALREIGRLYEFQWRHLELHFDELQLDFLRKAIAATIWAYALPYSGHHKHPKSMVAIMEFLNEYLARLSRTDVNGWKELSLDFSRGLTSFVKRIEFDDEIEDRYVDVLQD